MPNDIRVLTSFKGHRKRKRLKRLIGPGATDYLIDLWITVAMDCPSGILEGWDATDIADAAGWPEDKDPKKLVDALIEARWVDSDNGCYHMHDWEEHQPWICQAKERSAIARHAAQQRWLKHVACTPHARGNAPTNQPKLPNQPSNKQTKKPAPKRKQKARAKPKTEFYIPSLDEVKVYFRDNKYREDVAIRAFNYYENMVGPEGNPTPWHKANGEPVRSWKSTMNAVWFKDENKTGPLKKDYSWME